MQYLGFELTSPVFLAPMAGVTDKPFRKLVKKLGAGLAVSEMVTSNSLLYGSVKTRLRANHEGEVSPRVVQIAGADPELMAESARYNIDQGAQIIDINMGCPAKKICKVMAGSALLRDEKLVTRILGAVVRAVPHHPVTLKIRTGWDQASINASNIARIAQDEGVQALAIHGRTRAQAYTGQAEYDTIAEVKQLVRIPIIANGDIDSPQKAAAVLNYTAADGVMIGRAAQGRPWLAGEIGHYLAYGELLPEPTNAQKQAWLEDHVLGLYQFYGEERGVRIARKHIGWYSKGIDHSAPFRQQLNTLTEPTSQLTAIRQFFSMPEVGLQPA